MDEMKLNLGSRFMKKMVSKLISKYLSKHKRKHKKFMKFIGFIFLSMIIGPFYVAWIMVKWAFILPWKLFKVIFRIGR